MGCFCVSCRFWSVERRRSPEGGEHRLGAGDILFAPKGVPHQYLVESAEGGHWLTITVSGDFERFVREVSRPAARPELPEPSGPPSPEAKKALAEKSASYGIEIVGPPLH